VIIIDSNVLIDIFDKDPNWYLWSRSQMEAASQVGALLINHIILAEVAPHHGELTAFHEQIKAMMINVLPLSDKAAYTAGIAFLEYRKRREGSSSVIADFLIGGHAQALGATILTRDPRFYKAYFPTVQLIAPIKDDND
jgi:predicted nucleic acid-binding protein